MPWPWEKKEPKRHKIVRDEDVPEIDWDNLEPGKKASKPSKPKKTKQPKNAKKTIRSYRERQKAVDKALGF